MAIKYKIKCIRCKKNYVTGNWKSKYVVCYECQKKEMQGEIKDPKLKKLLKIPEEFYKQSTFLRDIKINAIRYNNLTERQIEAFKKVVKKFKEDSKA